MYGRRIYFSKKTLRHTQDVPCKDMPGCIYGSGNVYVPRGFDLNPEFTAFSLCVFRSRAMSGPRKLLPSLLPLLSVEKRVLLPGSSMVLEVSDPRGYGEFVMLLDQEVWSVSELSAPG